MDSPLLPTPSHNTRDACCSSTNSYTITLLLSLSQHSPPDLSPHWPIHRTQQIRDDLRYPGGSGDKVAGLPEGNGRGWEDDALSLSLSTLSLFGVEEGTCSRKTSVAQRRGGRETEEGGGLARDGQVSRIYGTKGRWGQIHCSRRRFQFGKLFHGIFTDLPLSHSSGRTLVPLTRYASGNHWRVFGSLAAGCDFLKDVD